MRTIEKAFLSCAIVAVAALLAATPAMATGSGSGSCTYPVSGAIEVISVPPGAPEGVTGACPVAQADLATPPTPCKSHGEWTGIQYRFADYKAGDVITTLVTVNNTTANVSVPTGFTAYALGTGEPKTGLGTSSVHERAIKITALAADKTFWVLVKGNKQPLLTSVAVKRGSYCTLKSYAVLGLGLDIPEGCVSTCGNFNAKQAVKNIQIVVWEGCEITKYFSPTTGAFQGVTVTGEGCTVLPGEGLYDGGVTPPPPVTGLFLGDEQVTFGDGDATTGDNSCFNTFVGGVYARVCK
jgi:hypothetical protein